MIWTRLNKNQEEMKKKKTRKDTSYDCLINYIPKPLRKTVRFFKDKVVSLFKTNTHEGFGKQTV